MSLHQLMLQSRSAGYQPSIKPSFERKLASLSVTNMSSRGVRSTREMHTARKNTAYVLRLCSLAPALCSAHSII